MEVESGVAGPSFDDYVRARGKALVRFAYLLTADWALAEDLVQDALAAVHPKWQRIEVMDFPEAYVKQAVTRRFLSWRRRRWAGERPSGLLADRHEPPSGGYTHAEALVDRDEMWDALRVLPRQQRAVLVLRYYEDQADDQIAAVLGCSTSTVRVHASRGVAALRKHVPVEQRSGRSL